MADEWKQYRLRADIEARPYDPEEDAGMGGANAGDWLARDPKDRDAVWIIDGEFFDAIYVKVV